MRPIVLALALSLGSLPLAAQTRQVSSNGKERPLSSCGSERVESVVVGGADGARNPVLDGVAGEVSYWFRPEASAVVRSATVGVTVDRAGAAVSPVQSSGDSAFDRVARQAVEAAAHERAFERLAPAAGEAPVKVVVHFGEDAAGRPQKFVQRTICDAVALPTNPLPTFPLELQPLPRSVASQLVTQTKQITSGEVVARFLVDSMGVVDPRTFVVVKTTDPLFAREVLQVLPKLRYFPAEIAGRPTAQMLEQTFDFRVR